MCPEWAPGWEQPPIYKGLLISLAAHLPQSQVVTNIGTFQATTDLGERLEEDMMWFLFFRGLRSVMATSSKAASLNTGSQQVYEDINMGVGGT